MRREPMLPHGLMFHHFTDAVHPRGQGAISVEELDCLLHFVGVDRILAPQDWLSRMESDRLEDHHLCLSFDDGLRCQLDVALPLLDRYGLKAFWFPYTGPLTGEPDRLEIYRYFRTIQFDDLDDFYQTFDYVWQESPYAAHAHASLSTFDPSQYLANSPYYTDADRRFRFLRDQVFGPRVYQQFMDQLMHAFGFDPAEHYAQLWMSAEDLQRLKSEGHVIGLHTHTHPTNMPAQSLRTQAYEYCICSRWLREFTGETPQVVAYPCNLYNTGTLKIMQELGMRLGFRGDMAQPVPRRLEWPREDHSNLLRQLQSQQIAPATYCQPARGGQPTPDDGRKPSAMHCEP